MRKIKTLLVHAALRWAAKQVMADELAVGFESMVPIGGREVVEVRLAKRTVVDGWRCLECDRWEDAARVHGVPWCWRHGEEPVEMVAELGSLPR